MEVERSASIDSNSNASLRYEVQRGVPSPAIISQRVGKDAHTRCALSVTTGTAMPPLPDESVLRRHFYGSATLRHHAACIVKRVYHVVVLCLAGTGDVESGAMVHRTAINRQAE